MGRRHDQSTAVVAVLLLHGGREPGIPAPASGRDRTVATKRALRAILKASIEPERVAQFLIETSR
jgi:hypothetical protein